MDENYKKIVESFKEVKDQGFVESHRSNNTGIGKTYEDMMNVPENNLNEPDLNGYEIKTHREDSQSYVSLFTKSPDGPKRGENSRLRNTFGKLDAASGYNIFYCSLFTNRYSIVYDKYHIKLTIDDSNQRIYIEVMDLYDNRIDCNTYFSFSKLKDAYDKKLPKLLYVPTQRKTLENGNEAFHYNNGTIYENTSFDVFLQMLREGKIMLDIRLGVYASGKNEGKTHDHGTAFRIRAIDIEDLFNKNEDI